MTPEILEALSSVILMLGIGYYSRKHNILTEAAEGSLLKFLINVLLPCFVFSKVVGNPMIKNSDNALWAPLAGFLGVTVSVVICLFFARYVFKIKSLKEKTAQSTFAVATGLQNYGFIAIPVIERVFGDDLLGIMLLHNMGVELAIWSIAIMVLSGKLGKEAILKMVNGPSIAVILSIIINSSGFDAYIPEFFKLSMDSVGAAFIPMGIILIGTTIYGCLQTPEAKLREWVKDYQLLLTAHFLRSGLLPLIIIYMAYAMPYSEGLLKVIIVEAAMPAAFIPIVLSKFYGGKPAIAMKISLTSMVVGFIVLPFWVSFGRSVLGV